jgi:16S rRNA (adenine1518-N6/adenine1519-N6)-dimethyltransferase
VLDNIKKHGIVVKKHFGQNFLTDTHVLNKIISAAAVSADDYVLEVGPGIGGLTQALASRARKVVAVELDSSLIPVLQENLRGFDNVELVNADILKLELSDIIPRGERVTVVANLQYYITTPVIMRLLESGCAQSMTVMLQKEVAARLCAKPGTPDYGAITLAVAYHADVYLAANVPANCFVPRPNVDSAVIRLDVLAEPRIHTANPELLFRVIRAAFNQRRKTLVNSVYNTAGLDVPKERIAEAIKTAGLDENVRGEELGLEEFGRLAALLCGGA